MINPFELSRLLDKTHHLKTKKDPIAPWIFLVNRPREDVEADGGE